MNDETIEDDMRRRHELEMLRARNPKIAKVEARRDIKVARANSENTAIVRGILIAATAITLVLLGISGCSVMVWGNDEPVTRPTQEQIDQEKQDDYDRYTTCTENQGRYDEDENKCSFVD